eukprot:scaffold8075_cov484-Prasinococcus_capsulatus_cf.AAC.2
MMNAASPGHDWCRWPSVAPARSHVQLGDRNAAPPAGSARGTWRVPTVAARPHTRLAVHHLFAVAATSIAAAREVSCAVAAPALSVSAGPVAVDREHAVVARGKSAQRARAAGDEARSPSVRRVR